MLVMLLIGAVAGYLLGLWVAGRKDDPPMPIDDELQDQADRSW